MASVIKPYGEADLVLIELKTVCEKLIGRNVLFV